MGALYSQDMKRQLTIEEFRALPVQEVLLTPAIPPACSELPFDPVSKNAPQLEGLPAEDSENYRQLLHRRAITPFDCPSPYQHGGINE